MTRKDLIQLISESILNELGENNITPTVPMLQKWFHELNEKYFNNVLPDIRIEVEPLGTTMLGKFSSNGRVFNKRTRMWLKPFNPEYVHIGITSNYDGPEYEIKNTLLHEMVHYYIHYKLDYVPTRHHGEEFLREASRVNRIAKQFGETYEVTPTSDAIENTVSQAGLERYKNRIKDKYIVGIAEFSGKDGGFWLFRCEEKFIKNIEYTYNDSTTLVGIKWYKLATDNPRFGIQMPVCRNRISGNHAWTLDDLKSKLKQEFGDIQLTPFDISSVAEREVSGKRYVIGVITNFDKEYYWTFKSEPKNMKDIISTYRSKYDAGLLRFYNVIDYDVNFERVRSSKKKIGKCARGTSPEESITRFKELYNCNFTIDE